MRILLLTSASVSSVLAMFYLILLCQCTKNSRSVGTQTGEAVDVEDLPGEKLADHGWDRRFKTSRLVIKTYKK